MNEPIASDSLLEVNRCFPRPSNPARAARVAASTLFLVDGMTFGVWAALIPSFQQRLGLTMGQLSGVLFALVVGALVSMPVAGRLIAAWGSRRVAFPAALGFCATLPLLALAPNAAALVAAGALFGMWKGALDVSVNAQGITVENAAGRPIFSSFQGFWSLGGLTAAFLLSFALSQGIPAPALMIIMSGLLFITALSTFGRLLPDATPTASAPRGWTFRRPSARLLWLGGLAFLALFSEGVLLDWSAVYAHDVVKAPMALAPLAFAVYALCMAGGRFLGDRLISRFGPTATLRISGILMTAGIAVAVLIPTWTTVLIGFAMVGFGIANLVPVIFGAAGRIDAHSAGPSLATVTSLGYFGFLSGPPVIGVIAALAGLPVAFAMVIVFGVVLATLGVAVIHPHQSTAKEAA